MTVFKRLVFLPICLCCLFLVGVSINVAESTADVDAPVQSGSEYISYISVKPEFPENQINPDASYLDLKMVPGQVEMIPIQVKNNFKEPLNVYIRPETAVTGESGRVVYQPDLEKTPYDPSLTYPFTSLSHISDDNISLVPGETKTINLIIEMPEEPVDGMILGGVRFSTDNEFMTHAVDLTKENIDDYILGVRLIENEEEVPVALVLQDVFLDYLKNQNMFRLKLQNPTSVPITNMHIEASIYKSNSNKQLYSSILEDWMMAPNSNVLLSLPIPQETTIYPGKYTAIVNIASDQGEWEITHDFNITRQEAKESNQRVGNKLPFYAGIPQYVMIAIIAIIIIFMLLFLLGMIRRKLKKKKLKAQSASSELQDQKLQSKTPVKKQKKQDFAPAIMSSKKEIKKSKKSVNKKKVGSKSFNPPPKNKKLNSKGAEKKDTKKPGAIRIPFKGEKKKISYQVEDIGIEPQPVLKHGRTSSIDLWPRFKSKKKNKERNMPDE